MKAINLIVILSLLLLVIACVPPSEELAKINKTEKDTPQELEPVTEIEQEITVLPEVPKENKTIIENITNTTKNTTAPPITTAAQTQPPQIAGNTIVYTGGAIEMGEGESAKVIIK